MFVAAAAFVDNVAVEGRAYQTHFVTVFGGRKCQCGAHHAGADDCDYFFHDKLKLWIVCFI